MDEINESSDANHSFGTDLAPTNYFSEGELLTIAEKNKALDDENNENTGHNVQDVGLVSTRLLELLQGTRRGSFPEK